MLAAAGGKQHPTFRDHIPTREALLARSAELFGLIRAVA